MRRVRDASVPSCVIRPAGRGRDATIDHVGRLRIDRLTGPPEPLRADGAVLATRCYRAATRRARLVGLLATPDLAPDEALWLPGCGSVHSVGLRAAIGCAFLDGAGRVLRVVDPLPSWRVAGARGARAVVECRAGVLGGRVRVGDRLRRDAFPATSGEAVSAGG